MHVCSPWRCGQKENEEGTLEAVVGDTARQMKRSKGPASTTIAFSTPDATTRTATTAATKTTATEATETEATTNELYHRTVVGACKGRGGGRERRAVGQECEAAAK